MADMDTGALRLCSKPKAGRLTLSEWNISGDERGSKYRISNPRKDDYGSMTDLVSACDHNMPIMSGRMILCRIAPGMEKHLRC